MKGIWLFILTSTGPDSVYSSSATLSGYAIFISIPGTSPCITTEFWLVRFDDKSLLILRSNPTNVMFGGRCGIDLVVMQPACSATQIDCGTLFRPTCKVLDQATRRPVFQLQRRLHRKTDRTRASFERVLTMLWRQTDLTSCSRALLEPEIRRNIAFS